MDDLSFFRARSGLLLAALATLGSAELCDGCDPALLISGVAPVDRARRGDVTMIGDEHDETDIASIRATACFVSARHAAALPPGVAALVTEDATAAFSLAAAVLHPDSIVPGSAMERTGVDATAIVHRDARLEQDVTIDPGAVIGPRVEIGSGTIIGSNATIGAGVRIGRDCAIGSLVSITHALIGDRVVIQAGARIGQPEVPRDGPLRPRLGRVIIQNDVAIGANASVARGSATDTVLGEKSRVEALAIVEGDRHLPRGSLVARL